MHRETSSQRVGFETSTTKNPYITLFQVSKNSSDFTPFVISPGSENNAWAVMVQTRNGKPPIAQILNLTIGPSGPNWTYVLPQPMITIPSDIVYNQTAQKTRVWLLENDSLAYYNPQLHNLTIAQTFANDSPQYMALDKAGDVWLTLLTSNRIAEFDPATNTTKYYNAPTPNSALQGITVAPDGTIWFAETVAKRLGHLIPCPLSQCIITDYSPPPGVSISFPIHVAVDHSGTVWFTDHGSNEFGSFNPMTKLWRTFPIGYCYEWYNPDCAIGLPNAISVDSSGLVWFSEHFAGRIAKYNSTSGMLTEYRIPATATPYTWWMSPGPGNLVWFTSFGLGEIGYVNSSIDVPISLSTRSELQIAPGTSGSLQANVSGSDTVLYLNASSSTYDAPFGEGPLLYGSSTPNLVVPSTGTQTITFTVSAAWNLANGERYMAITGYDNNVAVNVYVRVDVVGDPSRYVPPSAVAGIGIGTATVYLRRFENRRRIRVREKLDAGSRQVLSQ